MKKVTIIIQHVYRKGGKDSSVLIEGRSIRETFEKFESIDAKMRGYGFRHISKRRI